MRYSELRIQLDKKDLEWVEAELIDNGYVSMMIDDPDDVRDILEHPDTYRYDYINEDIAAEMDRSPEITLFFEDNEKGRAELQTAEELLREIAGRMKGGRAADEQAASEEHRSDGQCAVSEGQAASEEHRTAGQCAVAKEHVSDEGLCDAAPDKDEPLRIRRLDAGDDSEWLYKWQEFFKPTKVGERIVVKPSWEDYAAGDNELVIEMDPGMAFGSGLHETTSMCIRALEQVLSDGYSEPDVMISRRPRVLDVGCGTGILAIAAVLLGASEALGIDIDPDAVRVARENIEHNSLADRISAQYGDLTEGVDYEADIVVANLMADLVIRLSPAASRHVRKGGIYITSGILDIKERVVSEAVMDAGFAIVDVLHDGEWCAIIAVRE